MKIGIAAAVLVVILGGALWMTGVIGGTVYGTSWLNGTSGGSAGDQVIIVIGEGGVPDGLAPDTEITIGSLDTGEAYCKAKIVEALDTPDGPGYAALCIEGL
ncbi:MAG: hypothetical protein GQ535_14605 [Rhodobacteraceae bacterium]|nr:hypothetical protein [Paracoccaceae bacterium]